MSAGKTEIAEVTMYGTRWCGDCRRAKQFLRERGIAFREVNIDPVPKNWYYA